MKLSVQKTAEVEKFSLAGRCEKNILDGGYKKIFLMVEARIHLILEDRWKQFSFSMVDERNYVILDGKWRE